MTLEILTIIGNIQSILVAIGVVLSFIKWKKRQTYIKLLGLSLFISVSANLLGTVLFGFNITPNYAVTAYYVFVFPVITLLYYHAIGKRHAIVFLSITVFYFIFSLLNLLFIQQDEMNSYTKLLMSVMIIFYAVYYFYWLLTELPITKLHLLPMFWINSGYIVFFSGTVFLSGLTTYIVNVLKDNFVYYLAFQTLLSIVQVLMFITALSIDIVKVQKQSHARKSGVPV
jgi:hypothetical protein